MNSNGNLTLNHITFVRGVYVTEEEAEIALIRKYIKDTKADVVDGWFEAEFDERNPRHNVRANTPGLAAPVTGIMTINSLFAGKQGSQTAQGQHLQSIIEGSFEDVANTTGLAAALQAKKAETDKKE